MVLGTFAQHLQAQLVSAWRLAWAATAEVVVDSDDEAFSYLAEFLAAQNTRPHFSPAEAAVAWWRSFVASRRGVSKNSATAKSVVVRTAYSSKDSKRPTLFYVPNDGNYKLPFGKETIYFTIATDKTTTTPIASYSSPRYNDSDRHQRDAISTGSARQTITLRSYSTSVEGFTTIQNLLTASVDAFFQKQNGKTSIFTFQQSRGGLGWKRFAQKPSRPLHTIILSQDIKQVLLEDVQSFFVSEDWYRNLGIPYRRGYLLHGPPGTGKTSFIFALAGELGMDVCMVNLSSPDLGDSSLASLLSDSPKNAILVFEDVDVAMGIKKLSESIPPPPVVGSVSSEAASDRKSGGGKMGRGNKNGSSVQMGNSEASNVTLSGLLNALDGLVAQEGRIVFMTTNNVSTLPAALLRPGRVDRRFLFPHASKDVAVRLFVRFYGDVLGEKEAVVMGTKVADMLGVEQETFGIAQLQGFYSRYREDPKSILENVDSFLKEVEEQKEESN
ncbi:mitochondrial chaperone [Podochytrium sp. JEL0797]|nr:mitochondrial chaperone [Podochytrium sp. JEL0797]